MKKTSFMILMVVVVLTALWCYRASDAQQSATGTTFKVGVVNVTEVLMRCQENLDREKDGIEKQQKIKAELEQLSSEAEAIKQELQNALEPGSQEFLDRRKEWFNKQAQLQAISEYQKEVLTIESQVWTEKLYEKLLANVSKVARMQGILLVLNKDETPFKGQSLQDLYNMILGRKVLFGAASLDLTALVLENMDSAYEQAMAG